MLKLNINALRMFVYITVAKAMHVCFLFFFFVKSMFFDKFNIDFKKIWTRQTLSIVSIFLLIVRIREKRCILLTKDVDLWTCFNCCRSYVSQWYSLYKIYIFSINLRKRLGSQFCYGRLVYLFGLYWDH